MDAILVPGGFGKRGVEGKIKAIRYARENSVPYLGICLGMQLAVIEYARNVAGLDGAHSTEFDPDTPHPVIALITEWQDRDGRVEQRDARLRSRRHHAPGRAGVPARCPIASVRQIYGQERIVERHRHRYEVNNHYLPRLEEAGLQRVAASRPRTDLCEMIELPGHPWFVGCQFHPGVHLDAARRTSAVQGVRPGRARLPQPAQAGSVGRAAAHGEHRLSGS